ncbi:hypothetical protein B0H13DRAFT_2333162 [Mycena leptocephala]|nr:hypothetical protein B0H13DRAFT_2333162 [Mycena leptocephala]
MLRSPLLVLTFVAASLLGLVNCATPSHALVAQFPGCTKKQTQDLAAIYTKANDYVHNAVNELDEEPSSTVFKTWFGQWSPSRWGAVRQRFNWIATNGYDTYTYKCLQKCKDADVLAYTFEFEPKVIYICPLFWTDTEYDKPATFVHEATHWKAASGNGIDPKTGKDIGPGTDDIVRGSATTCKDCRRLARDSPEKAILNADNYMWFAKEVVVAPVNGVAENEQQVLA